MSEQTKVTDQDIRDAMDEAPELPDGAWLEWVAERAGFEPGDGYLVAERIGENPEFFGGPEENTPPMRIHADTELEELPDEVLVDLTDNEFERYIDLECARYGLRLLPAHPGPEPQKPDVQPDVTTYEVKAGYSTMIEVADRADADKVRDAIGSVKEVRTRYRQGHNVFVGAETKSVKIEECHRLSEEKYEAHAGELKSYDQLHERWKEQRKGYDDANADRQEVRERAREVINAAYRRISRRREADRLWERYLDLAGGDENTAARFLRDADQDAYELLKDAGVAPDNAAV